VRRSLARIALLFTTSLACVAALELAVRFVLPEPPVTNFTAVPRSIRQPSELPGLPFTLRPGAVVRQSFPGDPRGYFGPEEALTYRINAQGFRGPEAAVPKPAGRFRIVGLGDSFTFGTGVREEDTFLAVLRRALAERGPYEVLNLGIMATGTSEQVSLLRHRALAYEPDLVLVCMFLNDAGGGAAQQAFNASPRAWQLEGWRARLRLLDRILRVRERWAAVEALARSYNESFADDAPGWRRARSALRDAHALAGEHGFRLGLVLFPVLYRLSDANPFGPAHAAVAAFAEAEGLPFLDLRPAFAGSDGPELWAHPTNQHPNAEGHRIAAAALRAFLEREGLLRR